MSDTTTTTTEAVKAEAPKLSLADYLSKTGFPEAALKPVTAEIDEYVALVAKVNGLISSINAAKAADPNNAEYLDSRWKANEKHEGIAATVEEFYAVAEAYENLLKKLRTFAKENLVEEALSEEATKAAKKSVAEAEPILKTTRDSIAAQLKMPEAMLEVHKIEIPADGLVSLLPVADSLKNARGRKAASASGIGAYMTRVGDILIDNVSTNVDGKGKMSYAAEKLSEMWGADRNPANRVTAEEIEQALFDKLDKPLRSVKSTEFPITAFEFSKDTIVDGKTIPQKAVITIHPAPKPTAAKSDETKTEDKVAEKVETKTEASAPAPAKKAATPAPKK